MHSRDIGPCDLLLIAVLGNNRREDQGRVATSGRDKGAGAECISVVVGLTETVCELLENMGLVHYNCGGDRAVRNNEN